MAAVPGLMRCGGTSDDKPADSDVQDILNNLRADIEGQLGGKVEELTAISYKTQVVAGTNYFIKAHIGGNNHIHVRVFRALGCNGGNLKLSRLQTGKSAEDPIEHF